MLCHNGVPPEGATHDLEGNAIPAKTDKLIKCACGPEYKTGGHYRNHIMTKHNGQVPKGSTHDIEGIPLAQWENKIWKATPNGAENAQILSQQQGDEMERVSD